MTKIFIDGSAGTTGLRIYERLAERDELLLIKLTEENRKDPSARREAICEADIVFLCLPDAAAIEAVVLAAGSNAAIIDTSTAHRTSAEWTYGFPELIGQRERIAQSKRIANPGCHASGFIALVEPLVTAGLLPKESLLSSFSLTGYSGGGKKMIADYEADGRDSLLSAPRQYALGQKHKHLPEMKLYCGLDSEPVFCPIVADYYCGMEVTVPLHADMIKGSVDDIRQIYADRYNGPIIRYISDPSESGFLSASAYAFNDGMEVSVYGCDDRIILTSRFDNLGKGASGAAIQNMNILLGVDETRGLNV